MAAEVMEKPVMVNHSFRGISKIRSIVTDVVEDGVRSANHAIKHGRYAGEDALDQVKHTVKQRPFQAVGTAFAAGYSVLNATEERLSQLRGIISAALVE